MLPSIADVLAANLLSPIVLAFALGVVATLVRSDLEFPRDLSSALSIYLLLAIGLKGGVEIARTPAADLVLPIAATLLLGIVTPLSAYAVLRGLGRFAVPDAAAIAAHYGSVSVVTFVAAQGFARAMGAPAEGFLPSLVALLEAPAIVVALLLARLQGSTGTLGEALRDVTTGKSIVLLAGGLLIGALAGEHGMEPVEPFFVSGFKGALTLFLLDLGIIAARRLADVRRVGVFLVAFGIVVPVLHGFLGVVLGAASGLGAGGSAVLGAMAASASYIAAPAAVRVAIPDANPSYYLTASLGITFPFNLTVGIPLYFAAARWVVTWIA